jgi:diguanylate cyclase (GGDEF)-like protein
MSELESPGRRQPVEAEKPALATGPVVDPLQGSRATKRLVQLGVYMAILGYGPLYLFVLGYQPRQVLSSWTVGFIIATIAIELAFAQIRKWRKRTTYPGVVLAEMGQCQSVDTAVERVLWVLHRHMKLDASFLALRTGGSELELASILGLGKRDAEQLLSAGGPNIQEAMSSGEPVAFGLPRPKGARRCERVVFVPVAVPQKAIGVLALGSRKRDPDLKDDQLLSGIGTAVGMSLENLSQQEEIRGSERRLREQNRTLAELAMNNTVDTDDLSAVVRKITEAAVRTLDIERASVWLYNDDRTEIHCIDLYERGAGRHSDGLELAASSYPTYFKALEQERTIAAQDARSDPRTSEFRKTYLEPLGITSMMDTHIRLGGEPVGIMCCEHVGSARQWALEEQSFAGSMADLVALAMEARERRRAEATIRHLAYHDGLTDLPNRTLFQDRLSVALAQARRKERMLAVVFLDLDRFKLVNDTVGHAGGDELLRRIAERLKGLVREGDTVARLGGDEFTLLLPEIDKEDDTVDIARRILDRIAQPLTLDEHHFHVSASIGIATYPEDGDDAETLLRNADTAMYGAKEMGGNNYQTYTPAMKAQIAVRVDLEHSLRRALKNEEFVVNYQPQINAGTGKVVGAEALVRWRHPERGLILPGEFIPVAEETGLIEGVGEWVLRTACAQGEQWRRAGLPSMRLAVNLSGRQFHQRDLLEMVASALTESGLPPSRLQLEITEGVAMRDMDFTIATLRRLREMDVQISIDDFGTGYSSLTSLKRFPVSALKIDQSFVRDLTVDPNDAAICATIISMAHGLNLSAIAEGVETEEQLAHLVRLECDELQGFLFSGPVPAQEFEAIVASGRRKLRAPVAVDAD